MVDRSIPEVQDFFVWLRWNLENKHRYHDLPDCATLPDLKRGLETAPWTRPKGLDMRKRAAL